MKELSISSIEALTNYRDIEHLTEKEEGPLLVREESSQSFWVKKKYSIELAKRLETLRMLEHPNLPKIHELVADGEYLWVFEEYIHGNNITELLRVTSKMTTLQILEIAKGVSSALIALHRKKIVHRDVKPSNIMLTNDGIVKLIDFDALRFHDFSKESDTVNLGTIGFASPEQFGFAQSDERSDLYSLGVVMNVCATGAYPKDNLTEKPRLRGIIEKATRLDPKDRYQTARMMRDSIDSMIREIQFRSASSNNSILKKVAIAADVDATENSGKNPDDMGAEKKKSWRNIVPGFRTGTLWKETIAAIFYGGYLLFLSVTYSLGEGNVADGLILVAQMLLTFIPYLLLFTNFMNFHAYVPLLKHKNIYIRLLGIAIVAFLLFFVIAFGMQLLQNQLSTH